MAVERLGFSDSAEAYDAHQASQHAARYSLVRERCKGLRVLDVSCGEGFGSFLMASWGASEVVAVDISNEAIENAAQNFAHERVRYIVGDVLQLDDILADERPFDLIVSFETIEHVADPALFLRHLSKFAAANGLIVISCPNDHVQGESNPFHMRAYTFQDFHDLATSVLGPAKQWLVGTPILGQLNYVLGDPSVEAPSPKPTNIVNLKPCSALLAPSQVNLRPSISDCTYYVGVWGDRLDPSAVVTAQSYKTYVEPWAGLYAAREKLAEATARHEKSMIIMRQRVAYHAEGHAELGKIQTELTRTKNENAVMMAELTTLRHEMSVWWQYRQSRAFWFAKKYYGLYGNRFLRVPLKAARFVIQRLLK